MPDWTDADNEWDDDAGDWDEDDLDDEPTIACRYCGREIHEDAQRCPYCEQYLSDEDVPSPRKPWWVVLGVVLVLCMVYRWIFG